MLTKVSRVVMLKWIPAWKPSSIEYSSEILIRVWQYITVKLLPECYHSCLLLLFLPFSLVFGV
ncbi:unnamed protein product [Cylicostephanus goldi]|uniref:Uncharacterized protein n=1 Tax=Cylicostephanus goldi TaxID=71465 RepID=A0A3P6V4B2_CYLGO|nr:unnamed protein product [Cylicostephanus goldi]